MQKRKVRIITFLFVSALLTGISTGSSFAATRSMSAPLPAPSPAPGPSPAPVTYLPSNTSNVLASIQNSQIYGTITNSQTVETVRTINEGLAGTGLVGAAAQAGRFGFTLLKAAFTLWLLAE